MSTSPFDLLLQLGRHRWMMPLLARVADSNGARFVELLHSLDASRESLSRTLEAAIAAGWLIRNPGHGHPLRPEYVLTNVGRDASRLCRSVTSAQTEIAMPLASLSRWSLPVLHLVDRGENRFGGLARALPQSNPGALTQSLKSMISQQLLDRLVIDAFPPIPEYRIAPRGQVLAEALYQS